MTFPAQRVGDKGQRYEIIGKMVSSGQEEVLGYCTRKPNEKIKKYKLWPEVYPASVRFVDRMKVKNAK